VRAVVLGTVRGVAEGAVTAVLLAAVGPLAGVRSQVNLEVLEARERLVARGKLHTRRHSHHNALVDIRLRPRLAADMSV